MAVLDASVLGAVYVWRDEHHEVAVRWLREHRGVVHTPTIALAEVASALRRTAAEEERVVDAALRDMTSGRPFALHTVGTALARKAAEIARDHRLKGCDAIYVALAQQLDDVLVTFDAEQLERAAQAVRVFRPT